jgi:hypothetical protein
MNLAEYNYLIYNKELLAIIWAFEEYRAELEGLANPMQVYSDYKVLKYFIITKNLSARQACWAELLLQYYFKIIYWVGKAN